MTRKVTWLNMWHSERDEVTWYFVKVITFCIPEMGSVNMGHGVKISHHYTSVWSNGESATAKAIANWSQVSKFQNIISGHSIPSKNPT